MCAMRGQAAYVAWQSAKIGRELSRLRLKLHMSKLEAQDRERQWIGRLFVGQSSRYRLARLV